MIDVRHQVSQVRREVGGTVLQAGEARVLTLSQSYPGPVDDLWDACTSPERIPRWFLPVSGDLRPGGRYQLEGNAGGVVERCDPPRGFDATWEFGGQVSWIRVRFAEEPGPRARLTLEHIARVGDDVWAQFGPGALGIGWDGAFLGMAQHLEGGELTPDNAMVWMTSAEGRQFYALSSERWYAASLAAGTPESEARAAADRATAAYTQGPA